MKRLLGIVVGLLASGPALAAGLAVSWSAPVQNTDGTAVPPSGAGSIVSHRVEWGTCSGAVFGTRLGEQVVPMPALTYTVADVGPGVYCARVFARNTYGSESTASNVGTKTVPAPTPNPPVLATVAVVAGMQQTPVYSVASNGKSLSALVGFIDVGKACGSTVLVTFRDQAFHEVDRADVQWWGSTTLRVAAPCELGAG